MLEANDSEMTAQQSLPLDLKVLSTEPTHAKPGEMNMMSPEAKVRRASDEDMQYWENCYKQSQEAQIRLQNRDAAQRQGHHQQHMKEFDALSGDHEIINKAITWLMRTVKAIYTYVFHEGNEAAAFREEIRARFAVRELFEVEVLRSLKELKAIHGLEGVDCLVIPEHESNFTEEVD